MMAQRATASTHANCRVGRQSRPRLRGDVEVDHRGRDVVGAAVVEARAVESAENRHAPAVADDSYGATSS